jgi:amino acid adenylation domain-containing protein
MKECCFQHRLFEGFQKNGSRTAIEYGDKKITYSQLEKRAADVCGWIVENKIQKGSFIGVYIEDKIDFISVMIGIMAAGCVCVPLDTALPKNRIGKMLRMTGTAVVFTGMAGGGGGFGFITARKGLDSTGAERNAGLLNHGIEYRPSDPVYVYFTSGSTGPPGAIIGKNEGLLHFINWEINTFDIDANCRVSQLTNPGFDAFLRDVFVPLCAGGCLCIPERDEIVLDSRELVEWIDRNRVNVIHCMPGIFRVFNTNGLDPGNFKYLEHILLSGERIKAGELEKWYQTFDGRVQLVNLYGSTETTMIKTCYFIRQKDSRKARIPIGKPIRGAQVFIFDRNMEVCGREIPGEIYVRTPYGTLGYCNEPELTRERFTPTPFSNDPGDILYKTGDSGRRLPDGNIELMGRLDRQVKIRGARVELEEIENVLLSHKDISEAVVVSREFTGANYLCAYFVSQRELGVPGLRDYLAAELPGYMVPSYFTRLDRIPLAPNRKTNYNGLPPPEVRFGKQSAAAAEERFSSIEPAEKKEYYPLTPAQKRLYMLQQMAADSTAYNMPRIIPLNRPVNKKELEITFKQLIRRHESLRTSFHIIDEEPVQKIHENVEFEIQDYEPPLTLYRLSLTPLFIRPFDLSRAPLLRVGLIKMAAYRYLLLVDMHHIIADGISLQLLAGEFMALDEGGSLSQLQLQYKDYALWQNTRVRQETLNQQESYWLKTFAGEIPVLDLPLDYPRPGVKGFEGSVVTGVINKEETQALRAVAARECVTLYMVLSAVVVVLLSRLSGQDEVVIGSPTAGRPHAHLQQVIGMFGNTLALSHFPNGEKPFNEFLREVKEKTLEAFDNQDYPFEELVEKGGADRAAGRNPLFDVMFSLHKREEPREDIGQTSYNVDYHAAKFDLTLTAVEETDCIQLHFLYSTQLFKKETIRRFLNYFNKLLSQILRNPAQKISWLELITGQEKRLVLYDFNDTAVPYPGDKTIHRLFEEQVERTPDHVSLVIGQWSVLKRPLYLTYRVLNERANQVANYLYLEENIQPDDRVGVLMGPSIDRVTAILGILKAGGAYVPLDPGLPEERIKTMIDDADIGVVISQKKETWRLQRLLSECLSFHSFLRMGIELFHDIYSLVEDSFSEENPAFLQVKPYHLAYVIYTSGTTGKPKGVMADHRSLVNLCSWHNRYYRITGEDRATQYAGFGFDASVWEVFPYLVKGASIYLMDDEIKLDIYELNSCLEKHRITTSFLPTQLCEQFMGLRNRCLKRLLTGGDKLRVFRKNSDVLYTLYNNYGPTENTVVTTVYPVEHMEDNIPIGKPVDNNRIYILNRYNMQVQPIGVPGELYIAGDNLARGYLNNPELTAEKFIVFNRSYRSYRSYISYRSGDLARWRRDGNIQFLGRLDQQVKIRGYRIELGEIETRLLTHHWVKQACVIDREEPSGNKFICAYIQMNKKSLPGPSLEEELKKYLSFSLPDYMIPDCFVIMEKMPLTRSGKIDRKALPAPQRMFIIRKKFISTC